MYEDGGGGGGEDGGGTDSKANDSTSGDDDGSGGGKDFDDDSSWTDDGFSLSSSLSSSSSSSSSSASDGGTDEHETGPPSTGNRSKWLKTLWTIIDRMEGERKGRRVDVAGKRSARPVKTILRPPTTYKYVIGMSGFPSKVPVYPKRM